MRRIVAITVFLMCAVPALAKEVLPFIENDWTRAVASAKTKKTPIFVDAWAPW